MAIFHVGQRAKKGLRMVVVEPVEGSGDEVLDVTNAQDDASAFQAMVDQAIEQVVEGLVEDINEDEDDDNDEDYEDVEDEEEEDEEEEEEEGEDEDDEEQEDGGHSHSHHGHSHAAGDHGHSHGGAAKKLPTTWDYISLQLFHPAVQGPNLKLLMNASLFAASIYVSHHFGYLLAQ